MSRRSEFEASQHKQLTEPERLAEAYRGCSAKQIEVARRRYLNRLANTYQTAHSNKSDYWQDRLATVMSGADWFKKQVAGGIGED